MQCQTIKKNHVCLKNTYIKMLKIFLQIHLNVKKFN